MPENVDLMTSRQVFFYEVQLVLHLNVQFEAVLKMNLLIFKIIDLRNAYHHDYALLYHAILTAY